MKKRGILLMLISMLLPMRLSAQPAVYQLVDVIALPEVMNAETYDSCNIEFREQWAIDPSGASISKEVDSIGLSCTQGIEIFSSSKDPVRLKDISYEFSFLDPHNVSGEEVQRSLIDLINGHYPVNRIYDMPLQLLSVYFHEEWLIDAATQSITKKVKAITPVIWQQRMTTDHEPVNDAETGLPVYFKVKLQRIDLRKP